MYKPGTQLILNDLWAAAAADKLGFSVTTVFEDLDGSITRRGHFYTSSHPESTETLVHWRITVTESGPNAAEKFLPQLGDTVLAWCYPDADPQPPAMEVVHRLGDCDQDWCTFDITPDGSQIKRILERNGIPFPQFSEVIEP